MLRIEALGASYGRVQILRGVDVRVAPGEIVAVVGPNGAGKTTLLRAVSGLLPASSGRVLFQASDVTTVPAEERVRLGLSMVPEGREVFTNLTVQKNLALGAYHRLRRDRASDIVADMEEIFGMFPILRERSSQKAGTLSGGEQQMLAIGRALMARPVMILLDEPSLGLAPLLVKDILRTILSFREKGLACLVVEQNAQAILRIAQRGYVLQGGRIAAQDKGEDLLRDPATVTLYLTGKGTADHRGAR